MTEQNYKKKLIEVALPLLLINSACAHESKPGIRKHPRSLHKWFAQRRLASVRAILYAQLIDDPNNNLPEKEALNERKKHFKIIEQIIDWDNTYDDTLFSKVRKSMSQQVFHDKIIIADPFCGGGSIPLEAQRLGLDFMASDLNPISVLLTKALVEIPPLFKSQKPINPGTLHGVNSSASVLGLVSDIQYYGNIINEQAKAKIGHLYPKINNKTVLAWLWARQVPCPSPACNIKTPLVKTFTVCKTKRRQVQLVPIVNVRDRTISYKIEEAKDSENNIQGTVGRKGVNCICCKTPITFEYIRKCGSGGKLDYTLIGIVLESKAGREYIPPVKDHEALASSAVPPWVPETKLPEKALGFRVQLYGMTHHKDLFTVRQLTALSTFCDLVKNMHNQIRVDATRAGMIDDGIALEQGGNGSTAYADAICTYLAFAIDRCADTWSNISAWQNTVEAPGHTFGRHAVPMGWDFGESNPFSNSRGSWRSAYQWISQNVNLQGPGRGTVCQIDAANYQKNSNKLIYCTDPPYFDNIGYADLSDFFYVWLRKSIGSIYPNLFSTVLVPKSQELIASPHRFDGNAEKAKEHFINGLRRAFNNIVANQNEEYPLTIYYAFKQTESEESSDGILISSSGWETFLQALLDAPFQITGTWPIRTERENRSIAFGANALASSIVLVCRKKRKDVPISTRREFINTLKKELPSALKNLQEAGIAPVDMAQSAIGPGMAVFSRYSKVLEADGVPMSVRTALQIINQELDSYLTEQESELDKETRFCIAWFEQYGWKEGPFGDANTLANAKGTAVNALEQAGLVYAKAGKVRLLKRAELAENWIPSEDKKITVWKCVQQLIKELETNGEDTAASVLKKIGGLSDPVKELAYRLYALSDKKKWSEDAQAYNSLISSWQTVTDLAQFSRQVAEETKKKLKDKSQRTLSDGDEN